MAARQVVGAALDRVLGLDVGRPEAHVRYGHAAALVRVEDEVALRLQVRVHADRLDGRLAGAHRAVGAEPPEDALRRAGRCRVDRLAVRQRRVRDVIVDADDVAHARLVGVQVVENSLRHRRRELLRREAVLRARDQRRSIVIGHGDVDVEEQRHADGAVFARPVENGDLLDGRRQRVEEVLRRPRPVQMHRHRADLLAVAVHVVDGLLQRLRRRPHADGDAVGFRVSVVLEQLVGPAGEDGELIERLGDDVGRRLVVGVGSDRRLKEDVRALARAADRRVRRVEREVVQVLPHLVGGEHLRQLLVRHHLHLRHLGRRAVAVEEMQERDARLDRRDVRREAEVEHLLHGRRAHHREARLARRHHVRVVVEDGQRVLRDGSRRHVQHGRHELAGEQVHVGDHKQQALRRRESARQGAGGRGAVQGSGGTALRLHHVDVDHLTLKPRMSSTMS